MEESIEYKLSEFTKYLMALESRIQDAENTRKIAEEGFRLVQSKHTIDHRIKQMLQCLKLV